MANPLCTSGDGNEAVLVATMLTTGDGFVLCRECVGPWAAALLQAFTGIDATDQLTDPDQAVDPGDAVYGAPTDEPPAPAPSDTDGGNGWAASWVIEKETEEKPGKAAAGPPAAAGRSRPGSSGPAGRTGGRGETGSR